MSSTSGGNTGTSTPGAATTSSTALTNSSTPQATAPLTVNGTSALQTTAPVAVAVAVAPVQTAGAGAGPASKPGPGEPWWNRETRRVSDPSRAQQLWDAIVAVRAQKQIPAIVRMSRYMNRFYQVNKEQTQRLLDTAVEDNLIKLERKVGTKGNKSGVEEKAYRLPTSDMLPRERHDWYCFHCHSGGEVLLCEGCHRVYHESCLKAEAAACAQLKEARSLSQDEQDQDHDQELEDEDERDRSEWFCLYCKASQGATTEGGTKKARKDLNHLLRILCNKLRNRLPERILHREAPQPVQKAVNDPTSGIGGAKQEDEDADASGVGEDGTLGKVKNGDKEDAWRASFLLKSLINLEEMEKKCINNQYRLLEEFRADAQLIVHNIVIFHGGHSSLADASRQMLRDCTSDLREIALCRDCYRYANEQREKYWFCKPCRPYHDLVYAKQKGFPYWPAKVVGRRKKGDTLDVRFFGGYHQKATVEKNHVKPITVNVHTLQVKRTSLWNKACEELRKHQELLAKYKNDDGFHNEPYGNHFITAPAGGDMRSQWAMNFGNSGHDSSQESNDDDENLESNPESPDKAQNKQESKKGKAQKQEVPTPSKAEESPAKKKKGKGKKIKKDDSSEDQVSSSCQESRFVNASVQTKGSAAQRKADKGAAATQEEFRLIVEKMRADFDQEKKRAVNVATRSLERDLERLKADHATEIEELMDNHKQELAENKKKQWCYHCEAEAIYWCCWNTAYCSIECQQEHWHKEHKRACRRKR